MRYLLTVMVILVVSCGSQRYYVVRHAEKAIVTKDSAGFTASNPPLSEPGQVRAIVLREELKNKHIKHIFSSNYPRTISTAKPLSEMKNDLPIQLYNPSRDSLDAFIGRLKAITKGSVLIVGHSNTIDDVVNRLTGMKHVPADLSESTYDNLYIITRKKDTMLFEQKKYGYPSNPEK
jgi:broad specificity phosphatase PhoE